MDRSNTATVQTVVRRALALLALAGWLNPLPLGAAKSSSKVQSAAVPDSTSPLKVIAPESSTPGPLFADPYPSPPSVLPADLESTEDTSVRSEAFFQYCLAVAAEELGDADAAAVFFNRALELDPSNTQLACRVAADLQKQKKTDEAILLLKATHQAVPREVRPAIELARIYLSSLRQADTALTYAERAYKLAPEDFSALSTYVEVCASGRLTQRIDDTLRKAVASAQTDVAYWLRAGELFRNALSVRGAPPGKAHLEKINALYRKAMDLDPTSVVSLERAADHFTLSQQYAEACRLYERANTLHRQQLQTNSLGLNQKLARALVLNEQPDSAIDLLEEVVKENPTATDPRELLGELYLQQGQLVSALSHFRTALDLNPSRLEDHVRLIQLQLRLKRGDEAADTAERARKAFPDSPGLTMLLAVALGEAKRHQEAISAFEAAEREFQASRTDALDAAFYLTYGAAAERAGLLEQAATLLNKSISLDPENAAEALNYLGFMWIDRGMNLEQAGTLVRKALGLRPNHPAYLDSLGWWYYRRGDLPAAAQELRKALQKIRREEAPEVYDHLGEVQEKMGNLPAAISAWEAALELDPSLDSVKEKLQRARASAQPQNP